MPAPQRRRSPESAPVRRLGAGHGDAEEPGHDQHRRRPAGNLALTQDAFELYAKKHPNLVSKFNFTKAPAPEIPGKLKAMQGAGRSDIDLVLTGTDFLAAGIEQGLLIEGPARHTRRSSRT